MSTKYNHYAKSLDEAFRTARDKYETGFRRLQVAESKYAASLHLIARNEEYIGENAKRQREAEYEYRAAKDDFDAIKKTTWKEYADTVEGLTNSLNKEIRDNNLVDPDQIDDHAVELLKSGVMTTDDYMSLIKRYDTNPTMLKLISKYAQEVSDNLRDSNHEEDKAAKLQYDVIVNQTKGGLSSVQKNWKDLVTLANTYNGQSNDRSPEVVCNMAAKWEDASRAAIENF